MELRLSVKSSATLADDFAALRAAAASMPTALANTVAEVGQPALLGAARSRRGTLTMSKNPKLKGELDVLPIVRDGTDHAETELVATPRGVWHLIEYGAKAHMMTPRKRKRRGAKTKSKALPTPYGPKSVVLHPGTEATGLFDGSMADAEPVIDAAVQKRFDELVEGVGVG